MKMPEKIPFELVVKLYGATVFRVCRAVLEPDDADDAWSETFLSALRAYEQLPVDAKLEGWLVTIAHRKAIDILRAGERKGRLFDSRGLENHDEAFDHSYGYEVEDAAGLDGMVQKAVLQLPLKQRQSVAYRHLAGLSYREIAGIVGGNEAAVRRAVADGIRNLRSILNGLDKDENASLKSRGKSSGSPIKNKAIGRSGNKTARKEK